MTLRLIYTIGRIGWNSLPRSRIADVKLYDFGVKIGFATTSTDRLFVTGFGERPLKKSNTPGETEILLCLLSGRREKSTTKL